MRIGKAQMATTAVVVIAVLTVTGCTREAASAADPSAPTSTTTSSSRPSSTRTPTSTEATTTSVVASAEQRPTTAPPVAAPRATVSSELQLVVAAVDIDAPIIEVGVTDSRVLEIPEDPAVVGRWGDGARPGDGTGSIVLAGHVDYNGRPGALRALASLEPGDQAVLAGSDGDKIYIAERVDVYQKQALPYEAIFQYDVSERLVIVTCGGRFDRAAGHYESNVVAYLRPA